MSNPEISIVLPVFNGEKYLRESVPSILSQSFTNFELIIVNDCSTDSTSEILDFYSSKDSRIKLITNEKNLKLPASLNKGFKSARGIYHTWTSDDNNLHENFLSELYDRILFSSSDIAFSDYNVIDKNSRLIKHNQVGPVEALVYANTIGASFLYKKEVFETSGGYREDLFLIEDYDFWVRAKLNGFNFSHVPYALYDYRIHPTSLSSTLSLNNILAPYLLGIRNKFKSVDKRWLFKSRVSLLYYGKNVLSKKQLFILLLEAFSLKPFSTFYLIITKGKKMICGFLKSSGKATI